MVYSDIYTFMLQLYGFIRRFFIRLYVKLIVFIGRLSRRNVNMFKKSSTDKLREM
jgi:hypothetical protein